jgi:hypothetical protein
VFLFEKLGVLGVLAVKEFCRKYEKAAREYSRAAFLLSFGALNANREAPKM